MQRIHSNIQDNSDMKEDCRRMFEVLSHRAELLTGTDKVLMTMYLEKGNTISQMAKLAGVTNSTMSRRIKNICHRLERDEYLICYRYRDKFMSLEMCIVKDYFLNGRSLRDVASRYRMTYYGVRQIILKAQNLVLQLQEDKSA